MSGRRCAMWLLFLAFFCGGMVGCHPGAETVKPPIPARPIPDRAAVVAALAATKPLTSLSTSFKLKSERSGKRDSVNGALAVASSPDAGERLRLELYSPLGPPALYATVTASKAMLFLPYAQQAMLTSDAPAELLARATGQALSLPHLLKALLGAPPPCQLLPPDHPGAIVYRPADDRIGVPCAASQGMASPGMSAQRGLVLLLEPETLRLSGVEAVGEHPFTLRLERPFTVQNQALPAPILPGLIRLEGQDLTLEFILEQDSVVVNEPLDASLFQLEAPPDARFGSLEAWLASQWATK